MPERPKLEARRAESGAMGFLERGQPAHPHQLGGLREHCKIPSGVRGGVPATKGFSRILNTQDTFQDSKTIMDHSQNV